MVSHSTVSILVALLFLSLCSTAYSQLGCFVGIPIARNLATCQWYNSQSCCSEKNSQDIKASFDNTGTQVGNVTIPTWVKNIFSECLDQLNLLVCFPCDGQQTRYLKYNLLQLRKEFTICESFCNKMFDKCRAVPTDTGLIGTRYSSGREFCNGMIAPSIGDWTTIVGTDSCFNAAPSANIGFVFVVLFVIINFFL